MACHVGGEYEGGEPGPGVLELLAVEDGEDVRLRQPHELEALGGVHLLEGGVVAVRYGERVVRVDEEVVVQADVTDVVGGGGEQADVLHLVGEFPAERAVEKEAVSGLGDVGAVELVVVAVLPRR